MGRTKGSKNGISTTKGYTAIGKKAVGIIDKNGNYIYEQMQKAKAKFKTKDLNPAMPGATARFLDKKNEIKQKVLEEQRKAAAKAQSMAMAKQMQGQKNSEQPATSLSNIRPQNEPKQQEPQQQKPKGKNIFEAMADKASKALNSGEKKISKKINTMTKNATEKAESAAVRSLGPKEIKKAVNQALENQLRPTEVKPKRIAKDDDNFGTFVKKDIVDRLANSLYKKNKKRNDDTRKTVNNLLNDERLQGDLRDIAEEYYKNGESGAVKYLANKVDKPSEIRKYLSAIADSANPTYKERKASTDDSMLDFVANDLQDRINDRKKKNNEKAVNKSTKQLTRIVKDKRLKNDIESFKKDPVNTAKKIANEYKNNPEARKKYNSVILDSKVPTYDKRKASNDDSMFDFVANDVQDRANDLKKKLKKKWVG